MLVTLFSLLFIVRVWRETSGELLSSATLPENSLGLDAWQILGRSRSARCVSIPSNFTLCAGLEYNQMRLPNLLGHETLNEAMIQSASWVPLLRVNCHPNAKLFLCSLFASVCLARHDPIKPCQSLCTEVQAGCEGRMEQYGFSWPEMLNCNQFPVSQDMCIQKPKTPTRQSSSNKCSACEQVGTIENILDNFCRSTHVFRASVKQVKPSFLGVKVQRSLKAHPSSQNGSSIQTKSQIRSRAAERFPRRIYFTDDRSNCRCDQFAASRQQHGKARKGRYLVMASHIGTTVKKYSANLILPWKKEKSFKRVVRMFRRLNCQQLGQYIRNRARREHGKRFNQKAGSRKDGDGTGSADDGNKNRQTNSNNPRHKHKKNLNNITNSSDINQVQTERQTNDNRNNGNSNDVDDDDNDDDDVGGETPLDNDAVDDNLINNVNNMDVVNTGNQRSLKRSVARHESETFEEHDAIEQWLDEVSSESNLVQP